MKREKFITAYCERSGIKPNQFGFRLGEEEYFAIPCDCGDDGCEGWAMRSARELGFDKYLELMEEHRAKRQEATPPLTQQQESL